MASQSLRTPRTITTPFGFPEGSRRKAANRIRDLYGSMFCDFLQPVRVPDADRAVAPSVRETNYFMIWLLFGVSLALIVAELRNVRLLWEVG